MKIAVIPARGGSKRIPRKNIKDFCGKPMIAYSIGTAIDSGVFDRIIVSTEDEEIAAVARQWGAETPFLRPLDLADDFTGTNVVAKHAIRWFKQQGHQIDFACCIYATAPLLQAEYLQQGLRRLEQSGKSYAFSVTSFPFAIQRAIRINGEGSVEAVHPEHVLTRSQDLEECFHDAGQFYWGTAQAFLNDVITFSSASLPVIIPRHLVQDVDSLEDWHRAELLYQAWRLGQSRKTP
jgi:pseudaminic acid cytidylyltransferase